MLKLKQVSKQYHMNQEPVLQEVSLSIQKGEFVAVIGPSGAGKTTLLRLVNRMLLPTEGEIWVDDVRLDVQKGTALRHIQQRIGMIFQDFCLVDEVTALDNVLHGCLARIPFWRAVGGRYPQMEVAKAHEALRKVGLEDKAGVLTGTLSGGQKQRVAIARALVQEADILLADEPVAALDPVTSRQILELLKSLQVEQNLTIVMNSHNIEQASAYADRLIGLRNGQIFLDAPSEQWTAQDFDALYKGESSI